MCGRGRLARVLASFNRRIAVSEPDVIELNPSRPDWRFGHRRRSNLRRSIQQLENPLAGRHGRLQDVVLFAEILNGPEEALGILDEGGENPDAHDRMNHAE